MKLYFIVLFFVLLLLPSVQNATGIALLKPVEEYRKKAEAPSISITTLITNKGELGSSFLRWYDDRYGFRDLLIRLKTQIDYSVFSKSDRIHIGLNGWLYYRNVLDNQKPGVERQPKRAMHKYYEELRTLSRYLRQQGITLVVLRMPLKDVIYPEYLPAIPVLPFHRNADLVSDLLRSSPDVIYLDVTTRLKALKPSLQIFHKTDFHWTDPAGFCIAEDLVNLLSQLEGQRPLWDHPLEMEKKVISGGQARFMPLLWSPAETSIFNKKTWTDETLYSKGDPPFREIYRAKNGNAQNVLPVTVVKGNSFFDALLRSGIANYFSELYICNSNVSFPDVLRILPTGTRYLIVQELAGISEHPHAVKWRDQQ